MCAIMSLWDAATTLLESIALPYTFSAVLPVLSSVGEESLEFCEKCPSVYPRQELVPVLTSIKIRLCALLALLSSTTSPATFITGLSSPTVA